MEEKKSKNKIVIIVVAVVVLVLLVIFGVVGMFVNDYMQKVVISSELEKINQTKQVDQEIKAKGKYADVEKAIKDYVIEYQEVGKEIQNEYQNEKFTTILSANNLQNDGPEFTETRKLISDVKAKGEETKTKLAEMVSEEYKEKRATESGLTGKYKDLFKQDIQLEGELETVNTTIDNVNNYLSKIEDIFNFLTENKGNWEVKNNQVQFTQMTLVTKYNSLLSLANIAAQKIK